MERINFYRPPLLNFSVFNFEVLKMLKVRKYFLIDKIKYVFFFCTKLLYELLDYKYVM